MLRHALFLWLCLCTSPTRGQYTGDFPEPYSNAQDRVAGNERHSPKPLPLSQPQPVRLADGQTVTNGAILSPTDELLEPYVATQVLYGQNYAEWCLRWNRLQYYLAEQRAISPRTLRGSVTTIAAYEQGSTSGLSLSRAATFNRSLNATSRTRPEIWEIGGYGGGPVMLYNPFVTR